MWIILVALGVLWATDVSLSPERRPSRSPLITAFQAAASGVGFAGAPRGARPAGGRDRFRSRCSPGIFASGVVSDVISNNPAGHGLLGAGDLLISATLMPWGAWFQTAIVVATAIPGVLSVWLCTGSLVSLGYAVGPGSIVLLASISVAHAFERARRERAASRPTCACSRR